MLRDALQPQTVIFWGAGATRALGIRTTPEQGQFVRCLTGAGERSSSLEDRVTAALDDKDLERWHAALVDLICILGDSEDAYHNIQKIEQDQFGAMRRNWRVGAGEEEIRREIIGLRLIYDWPALKSAVSICPGGTTGRFRLNDLFNLLTCTFHLHPDFAFQPQGGGSFSMRGGSSALRTRL
jgi:hypothetical protein